MDILLDAIRTIRDFPTPGVHFKDISALLEEHFELTLDALQDLHEWSQTDLILGIESRGFILGAALAAKVGVGFSPIRKKGKLPPPVYAQNYQLEYGEDTLELPKSGRPKRVVIVDDVLATGGTLKAARKLASQAGHKIQTSLVLLNLSALSGIEQNQQDLKAVFHLD